MCVVRMGEGVGFLVDGEVVEAGLLELHCAQDARHTCSDDREAQRPFRAHAHLRVESGSFHTSAMPASGAHIERTRTDQGSEDDPTGDSGGEGMERYRQILAALALVP